MQGAVWVSGCEITAKAEYLSHQIESQHNDYPRLETAADDRRKRCAERLLTIKLIADSSDCASQSKTNLEPIKLAAPVIKIITNSQSLKIK
jgi:hypothetical protein